MVQDKAATKTIEFIRCLVCYCLRLVWSTKSGADPKKNNWGPSDTQGPEAQVVEPTGKPLLVAPAMRHAGTPQVWRCLTVDQ